MDSVYYVGLDVHKKTISYCVKLADGRIVKEGGVATKRRELRPWVEQLPKPWHGALEATLFSDWIYDFLLPHARALQVANPAMLKAITAAKKKNDRVDARTIADLLRCNLLPACYVAPAPLRELRRLLRFRNLMVTQAVRMKNRTSGLLMEVGAEYSKEKLHQKGYFRDLLGTVENVPDSVIELLKMSRGATEMFETAQHRLVQGLLRHPRLQQRVERLQSIDGVGEILALTWALEVGEPERFRSVPRACSYCGLTSAQVSSAGKEQRGPISKQRNAHLQSMLVEAAKVAPRWNSTLAAVHERECARGNRNRATLAVARKLVAYLLAVDRSGKPFRPAPVGEEKPSSEIQERRALPIAAVAVVG
jgi:transposase